MTNVSGGVCSPKGFLAHGLPAGIKRSGKLDLGLLVSEVPAVTAGVFTLNSVKAAPLQVSRKHLAGGISRAVLVNSGNANCYTGAFGLKYAQASTKLIGELLGVKDSQVLVASTGIIGKQFPFNKITAAAGDLVKGLGQEGGTRFAEAIMTTDKAPKQIALKITLGGKRVLIGGCAKGSGMIEPNMATMLGFITTDAAISPALVKCALKEAVDKTFNCISVDGCMSTNDMVTLQANGLAGNAGIATRGGDYRRFSAALTAVCEDLARKIVQDGEGATKFLTIRVNGAASERQAKKIAKAVANSALVKTAAYGNNPNWGRVGAAVGSLGIKGIREDTMKITFSPFDQKEIAIMIDLTLGRAGACVHTCDLSGEYVRINGEYN